MSAHDDRDRKVYCRVVFIIALLTIFSSLEIFIVFSKKEKHPSKQQTQAMAYLRSEFEKNSTQNGLETDIAVQVLCQNETSTNEWAGNIPFVQKVTFRSYDEYERYLITNWLRLSKVINKDIYGKSPVIIVRSYATFDIGSNMARSIFREKKFGPPGNISSNSLVNVPIRQMRVFTKTEKLEL